MPPAAPKKEKGPHPLDTIPTAIGDLFMDSGAHALYNVHVFNIQGKNGYKWFDLTPGSEFRAYLASYAGFLKKFGWAIDYYTNVDVILNPELTWEVQQILEKDYGLKPVPVVHFGADMKWVQKYIDTGHDLIGVGGLGQGVSKAEFFGWGDELFEYICPRPKRLPIVRTHGFAMTSWELMVRYPWWSVDSASWVKAAAFGQIMVPHKRGGVFVWDEAPYVLSCSAKSPNMLERGRHITTLTTAERQVVLDWLKFIDVPFGSVDDKGEMVEMGVLSHHKPRSQCNLVYFQQLVASLPEYPWPLKINRKTGFL